ncbi:MAG: hypothetical protein ACXWLH_02210 [Candidatus Saccharimonadales bacterium]
MLLVLPFLTSLLLFFSFFFYRASWLVLVALLPLLFYLRVKGSTKNWHRHYRLVIWLSGLLFTALNSGWMLQIDPLIWAQSQPGAIKVLKLIGWIICSLAYSVNFMIFAFFGTDPLHNLLTKNKNRLAAAAKLIAIWIVADFVRAVVVSIIVWGHGASVGPYWNFNALGFALAGTPLGFLARLVGLYGLGGLVLAFNLGFYFLLQRNWRPLAIISASALILVVICYSSYRPNGPTIKVGVVQTHSVLNGYQTNLLSLMQNQTRSTDFPLDALVLPEGLRLDEESGSTSAHQILNQAFQGHNGLVITSGVPDINSKTIKTVLKNSHDEVLDSFGKNLLAPVGEYMPLVLQASYKLTGSQGLESSYSLHHSFNRASQPIRPYTFYGIVYGILSCSGINSSIQYQSLSQQGANILINSANLEIFDFGHYSTQIKQIARFQALANAKPFVQATNRSYSYAIDGNGKFEAESTAQNLAFFSTNLQTNHKRTVFSLLGEWTVIVSAIYLFYLTIVPVLTRQYGVLRRQR